MAGAKSSTNDTGAGWVACTTDSILATKDTLCDMLITMPAPHAAHAKERAWPTIECPRGVLVKATQRDLRRYRALRTGLTRLHQQQQPSCTASPTVPSRVSTTATTAPDSSNKNGQKSKETADEAYELTEDDERRIVEPLSWAALAYSGFMWWASAGEQGRSDEAEEAAHDAALLADLSSSSFPPFAVSASSALMNRNASAGPSVDLTTSVGSLAAAGEQHQRQQPDEARVELAVIAYFHRLTTGILGTLADIVDSGGSDSGPDPGDGGDDDDDRGDESAIEDEDENEALLGGADDADDDDVDGQETRRGGRGIRIGSQAMTDMGLDVWSGSDAAFVREVVERYFDRKAYVEGKGVEVCGVRVC